LKAALEEDGSPMGAWTYAFPDFPKSKTYDALIAGASRG
jgi:hypothetical protein